MADPKSRSAFIPLLIVGLLIAVTLLVTLVPILECRRCLSDDASILLKGLEEGEGTLPPRTFSEITACPGCDGRGKIPLMNLWGRE